MNSCFPSNFELRTKEFKGDDLEWRNGERDIRNKSRILTLSTSICYSKYYNMYGRHNKKIFPVATCKCYSGNLYTEGIKERIKFCNNNFKENHSAVNVIPSMYLCWLGEYYSLSRLKVHTLKIQPSKVSWNVQQKKNLNPLCVCTNTYCSSHNTWMPSKHIRSQSDGTTQKN